MRFLKNIVVLLFILGNAPNALSEVAIYVRPDGNDLSSGASSADAVLTLEAAIKRALEVPFEKNKEFKIVVGAGIYFAQSVIINDLPAGAKLTITARNSDRPIFDGTGRAKTWLSLKSGQGRPTNLIVQGLEIRNYLTAISITGNRSSPNLWNGENVISDNVFVNIGQIAMPLEPPSTAAIRLVNSRNNVIVGNFFKGIRNNKNCGALHAIYMAHHSSGNLIEGNTFDDGCGATIKVRDDSNFNIIRSNNFIGQEGAIFHDWYCNKETRMDCTKKTGECPSLGNKIVENTVVGVGGDRRGKLFEAFGDDYIDGCGSPINNLNKNGGHDFHEPRFLLKNNNI